MCRFCRYLVIFRQPSLPDTKTKVTINIENILPIFYTNGSICLKIADIGVHIHYHDNCVTTLLSVLFLACICICKSSYLCYKYFFLIIRIQAQTWTCPYGKLFAKYMVTSWGGSKDLTQWIIGLIDNILLNGHITYRRQWYPSD